MRVESVFIDEIVVGERRREEFGDLEGLAASIGKYNLLQPVVVTTNPDGRLYLMAGERRLRACRDILKWTEIPARFFSDLPEDERLEIELEENQQRKDLTEEEQSKRIVRQAQKAASIISDAVSEKKQGETRGRKSKYEAPKTDVAQVLGISDATLRRAEQHVEALTDFPELSVVPSQKSAINAAKKLKAMPKSERDAALSQLATEGETALKAITHKAPAPSKSKPKPPSGRHAADLSRIRAFIQTISSVGAEELTANWTDRETADFLSALRECRDEIGGLVSDLESVVKELQRRAS